MPAVLPGMDPKAVVDHDPKYKLTNKVVDGPNAYKKFPNTVSTSKVNHSTVFTDHSNEISPRPTSGKRYKAVPTRQDPFDASRKDHFNNVKHGGVKITKMDCHQERRQKFLQDFPRPLAKREASPPVSQTGDHKRDFITVNGVRFSKGRKSTSPPNGGITTANGISSNGQTPVQPSPTAEDVSTLPSPSRRFQSNPVRYNTAHTTVATHNAPTAVVEPSPRLSQRIQCTPRATSLRGVFQALHVTEPASHRVEAPWHTEQ